MRKKLLTAVTLGLSAIMVGSSVADATMFTIKFSENDIKINSSRSIGMESQFDYYPIKYTVDGSDPAAGEIFDSSTGVKLETGAYKLRAGVFTDDGEAISDTYEKYYVNGVSSKAVQTDKSKISYADYDEPNKRYPYNMFDGDASIGGLAKCWTIASMPITVSYDEPITANMCVITARVANAAVSWFQDGKNSAGTTATKSEQTTADMSITLDIRYKTSSGEYQSALNGGRKIVVPKGTEVTYKYADNRADVWVVFAFDTDKFKSDEVVFDFDAAENMGSIKELELFEANAKTYKVQYLPSNGKLSNGTTVTLKGNNTSAQAIRYTLDGTTPTNESAKYTAPIALADDSIVTVKSAVFDENGECISDTYTNTYVVGTHTNVGTQTDASKISATNATNPSLAFDGDSVLTHPQLTMGISRATHPAPAVVTVEYDNPIEIDTLAALVTVNESQFLKNVTAGGSGTNSDGNRGEKTETLIKDLALEFKIDYVKAGETDITEGEWTTVTLSEGSPCTWNYTNGYGRAWTYLPAVSFEKATVSKVIINIRGYAESETVAKIWSIKELELY